MSSASREPVLEVEDLCTYFRSEGEPVRAVDGISFSLGRGEVLGVVGESGSGKSVSALSVLGLLPRPAAYHPRGLVRYRGQNLLELPERELRRVRGNRISMVFQDPMTSLNPYLRIERQLTEVLELHKGMSRRQARARSIEMLELVGIPDASRRIDSYPHELSGGMRQRVMIAIALLCEPEVLIADEPTTALDVTIQAQILELIRDLQSRTGTSIVLITHDLGVVAGMADRVLVMYAGRIVERANTDDLYAAPQHPYTQGLLASIPRLNQERSALEAIPGLPPDLSRLPPGCAFAPRCPRASELCVARYPERTSLPHNGMVRCHHPGVGS